MRPGHAACEAHANRRYTDGHRDGTAQALERSAALLERIAGERDTRAAELRQTETLRDRADTYAEVARSLRKAATAIREGGGR